MTTDESIHLTKKQRRQQRQQEKKQLDGRQVRRTKMTKWSKRGMMILVLGAVGYGITVVTPDTLVLPPTTMAGHIEESPPSHIVEQPMALSVHKHMLEHADGEGPPGVIINYNCQDFSCSSDLIDTLSMFVNDNPEFVYLAPFDNMANMIAVTRLGDQITLDEYDEAVISEFIQ